MKKFMIMAVLATVLAAIPVFGEGPGTAINEQTQIATANALVPIFAQIRIRVGGRRRYRRRFVVRRYRRVYYRRHDDRYRRHERRYRRRLR